MYDHKCQPIGFYCENHSSALKSRDIFSTVIPQYLYSVVCKNRGGGGGVDCHHSSHTLIFRRVKHKNIDFNFTYILFQVDNTIFCKSNW